MSERPKTTDPLSPSRVWLKVGVVMILPIVATVLLVGNGLRENSDAATRAERTHGLATVVQASGDLVENLQNERAAAALLLADVNPARRGRDQSAYDRARAAVTGVATAYGDRRGELRDVPPAIATTLDEIDGGLRTLPDLRSAVASGKVSFTDATRGYNALVDNLLRVRDNAAQTAGDAALSQSMRAAAAVARGKEQLSQERLTVLQGYAAGALNANLRTQFIAAQTGVVQSLESFASVATQDEQTRFNDTVAGAKLRTSVAFASWVTGAMPPDGNLSNAPFNADSWDTALKDHGALIRDLERQLDGAVVDRAATARDDGRREALVEAGVPLAILLLAILLAVLVARSMTRARRDPRDGAGVPGGPVDPDRPLATTAAGR